MDFLEKDAVGESTLSVISKADKFNDWMYEIINPFCKGRILEIGSGIGNMSDCFNKDDKTILLSDIRKGYCDVLSQKYQNSSNVLGVQLIDLIDPHFDAINQELFGSFDTVFALNVVEHVEDDNQAIKNCKKLLKKGGRLIILVPSYDLLYNGLDKELGHYRRYNKKKLSKLFVDNDFNIIHKGYFNSVGLAGWVFTGSILKKDTIPDKQMGVYNNLVPVFKILDKAFTPFFGLSTIVVGVK